MAMYSLSWEQSRALFKTNGNLILIEQWTPSLDEFHLMKRLTTFPNPTLFINNILHECVYHFIFILLGLQRNEWINSRNKYSLQYLLSNSIYLKLDEKYRDWKYQTKRSE